MRTLLFATAMLLTAPAVANTQDVRGIRTWVVGDSTAQPLDQAFSALLKPPAPMRVRTFFKNSSGLIRTDVIDWPKTAEELLAHDAPDVAVLCFGPNDAQGILPRGAKAPVQLGTDAWRAEYAKRVRAFADQFRTRGAEVYVLLQPFSPTKKHAPLMRDVDAALAQAVALEPHDTGLHLVDVPALIDARRAELDHELETLAETQPKKANEMRQKGALKNVDGIHLTFAGGKVVAEHLLAEIVRTVQPRKK